MNRCHHRRDSWARRVPKIRDAKAFFDPLLGLLGFCCGGIFDRFYDRFLGWIDIDTGGSFGRFFDRFLDLLDFDTGGNFQQLQQRGIDAGDGIYPALAVTPISLWEHIKLVSDFFEFPKSFSLEF
jgi:hypothetical protein